VAPRLGGKLTLMSAPAGFGKTTLLSMWLAVSSRSGRSAVWLQQARGEYDSAKTTLETFSHLVHERNFFAPLLGHAGAAKARLALTQGNLPGAIAWVDANGLNIDEPSFPRELEYLTLVRVLIARGRGDPEGPYFGHALRLIDRLLEAAESGARMEPRKGSPHLRGGSAAVPRMLELTAHDLGGHFGLDKQCLLMEVRPGRL
jgi:hypothetical protein